jgi:N-acetylmuramoyl-L-alanine amidase
MKPRFGGGPRGTGVFGPLLCGLVVAGCGGSGHQLPTATCASMTKKAEGISTQLLEHQTVREVSRADLERLDRLWATAAQTCGKGPEGLAARLHRARRREDIARASRAPEDIRTALLSYAEIARYHPQAPETALALWRRASLALEFDQPRAGFALLTRLVKRHPNTSFGKRAVSALATLGHRRPPDTGTTAPGKKSRPRPSAHPNIVGRAVEPDRLGIRFPMTPHPRPLLRVRRWSTPAFSRVVCYFARPVRYLHGVLPAAGPRPARLYIDYPGAQLGRKVPRADAVKGHLVHGLRVANRPPGSVRLVLELSGPLRYQIYPLRHPYRVVIDLWKPGLRHVRTGQRPKVRVVALDPGHGGAENGAVGPTGLKEKDITLAIARHAAKALKRGGLKPALTRDSDKTVSLEERSAIALAVGADLFVSIHANADLKGKQQGVETYYLDVGADQYAARLAARENRAAGRNIGAYRLVLADLTTRANTTESRRLAQFIQRNLHTAARVGRPGLPNRGVRKAIFYVLLTARVPGVLTEVSFLSHPRGEAALRQPETLKRLGESIARGILRYAGKKNQAGTR